MKLSTYLYRSALAGGSGLKARVFGRLRRWLLRFGDPDCEMEVHGCELAMPLSHQLPWHRLKHPCYDSLPERLSSHLRDRDGTVRAIDVGANIGDTIAALHLGPDDSALAIEPSPNFVRFLRENWGGDPRVTIVEAICSSGKAEEGGFVIEENDGTAQLRKIEDMEDAGAPAVRSLDILIARNPEFSEPNLIKIDTDGHDFEVLSGSSDVIERSKPIVFFECDAFENPNYLSNCREALGMFQRAGYAGMLVYDNFGYLMGRFAFDQWDVFEQLLTYQVTSEFYYFDLLLIENCADLDRFHESEIDFFAGRIEDPIMRESLSARPTSLGSRNVAETSVELAG